MTARDPGGERLLTPEELGLLVAEIPDFPRPGITFRDLTPILADNRALVSAISHLVAITREALDGGGVDLVIAAEARGFILGPALAAALGAGFIPTRKPGKLPRETLSAEYQLEYGVDSLHMHRDAIAPGDRVLVHDDLLATGGTAAAAARLVERLGGEIAAYSFVIELAGLGGREALPQAPTVSLLRFDR